MKKIKILLKLILIFILGIVVISCFKYGISAASAKGTGGAKINSSGILYNTGDSTKYTTTKTLAKRIKSSRKTLLSANLKSLMGAYIGYDSGWSNYYTAGCFAHWMSSSTKNTGYLFRQALYFGMDSDGNYVATNYYYVESSKSQKSQSRTQKQVYTGWLGKLAGAIIYQINTGKATYGTTGSSLTQLYNYFWAAIRDGDIKANSIIKTLLDYKTGGENTASQEYAASYKSKIKSYSAVSATKSSSASITTNGSYTVLGPITVTYGSGKISGITAYEKGSSYTKINATIYWATSKSSSSPKSSYSSITSGKTIYIYIKSSKIADDTTKIKITFTQDTGLYECALIVAANGKYASQSTGFFTCSSSTIKKTSSVSFSITPGIDINIKIIKKDTSTDEYIDDIGFTIYDNKREVYITANGGTSSSAKTIYTVDGVIEIELEDLTTGTYSFTVTEVSSNNEYYFCTSQTSTKSRSTSGTLTYTFYNNPITLTILKSDLNYSDGDSGSGDAQSSTFNSLFTKYGGTSVSYDNLVTLLNNVINNTTEDHQITVNGETITDTSGIPFYNATYTVTFTYTDDYITGITYTVNFNSIFEEYIGSDYNYEDIQELVDLVITCNEFFSGEHSVTINGETITSSLSDNDYWVGEFTTSAEYDSNGYINNIIYTYSEEITISSSELNYDIIYYYAYSGDTTVIDEIKEAYNISRRF